jgi:hypothetical protein
VFEGELPTALARQRDEMLGSEPSDWDA